MDDLTEIQIPGLINLDTEDGTHLQLSGTREHGYLIEAIRTGDNEIDDEGIEFSLTAEQLQQLQLAVAALLTQ